MQQNRSRLIKLLVILIIVFGALTLKSELPKFLPEKTDHAFSEIKKEQIKEIKITKTKTSHVYKKNKEWFIKNQDSEFRADKVRIEKIINAFINLKKENIVSTNKNKHQDLGINKQKIELKTDSKSYVIYIGNNEGLSNNYVRIDNENEVFFSEGFNEVFIDEDFRDLKVPIVKDEAKVTNIEINYQGNTTLLVKNEDDWKIGDKTAKRDRVDFYLNDLKTLKASDILKKNENSLVPDPELTINIKENGKEKTISFYPENEETYIATLTSIDYDYIVATAYVASLTKEEKDFVE